jgi:glycosyltransferase involved in cell wall biosynthesis
LKIDAALNPAEVTAVILTRDEERNLPRALTSLPRGMPVFVLDACSRDHTVQFARGAGATVVQREWTDFVDARRYALAQVQTPWAFMLDADEALDDVLRDAIVNAAGGADGYSVTRTTYFCGKPMRLWQGESLLRLFRPDRVRLEARGASGADVALHERWSSDGRVEALRGTLLHYSYPDVATYRAKYERYTEIEARGARPSFGAVLSTAAKCGVSLAYYLLGKRAVLDGWRGAYVAGYSAAYPAVVAWKALRRPVR